MEHQRTTALRTLLLIGFCFASLLSPVDAQERPAAPQYMESKSQRMTAGSIEHRGWQAGMIRANGNLSHFYWSPMTTIIQAPPEIPVGMTKVWRDPVRPNMAIPPSMSQPGFPQDIPASPYSEGKPVQVPTMVNHRAYVKPDHVPTVISDNPNEHKNGKPRHDDSLAGRLLPRRYVKPLHAPTLISPFDNIFGRLRPNHPALQNENNVCGQLVNRDAHGTLLSRPKALSYSDYNSSFSSAVSGQVTRTQVHAQLSPSRGH